MPGKGIFGGKVNCLIQRERDFAQHTLIFCVIGIEAPHANFNSVKTAQSYTIFHAWLWTESASVSIDQQQHFLADIEPPCVDVRAINMVKTNVAAQ